MTIVDKDVEIERLKALNTRLYYYVAVLLALGIASLIVNLRMVL